jgi:hypothetical protein
LTAIIAEELVLDEDVSYCWIESEGGVCLQSEAVDGDRHPVLLEKRVRII